MMIVHVDFETRSRCNLLTAGVYNYAQDVCTDVMCMSYAYDDGEVQTWLPGQPLPDFTGYQIRAWNAAFERLIFWYVLQQDYPLESFYCTAAEARANCSPGNLEDAGRFAGAGMRKDHRGKQLIKLMCVPRPDGTFNEDPDLMAEMIAYCEQDVRAMRSISKMMRPLSEQELADYHTNERINDLGVKIDVPLARAAIGYSAQEILDVQNLVKEITKGEITSVRSTKMRQWVQDRIGPEALKLMWNGEKYSVDKTVRANLLALADENPDEVPADVADVLQCASDIWSSSVAKFERMSQLADVEDHRVRGAFVFNGGSATGRASSYGLQVHNLGRKTAKDPAAVRAEIVSGKPLANVSTTLKSMIRPALIPADGNVFCVLDWSGIEARVNPWLSNHPQSQSVLDVFRQGKDIYVREAAAIFGCTEAEVNSDRRQIGKVAILSCGYGGGIKAFASMGRNYGVVLPEADAKRTVDAWRRANAWATTAWADLERGYMAAMRNKGHEIKVGRVAYLFSGGHLWYVLPSGRVLCYPHARFDADGAVSYAKAAWKPKADAKEWPRARLWGGLACENLTQAVANDLLRHSLRQIKDAVLHVHDEVVVECKEADADDTLAEMRRIMVNPPDWCPDLPLAVEGKVMLRYGK